MSDEVSDFLRSVEQLKGRREEEDEARSRELEEKILQERKERQARRAERARSISPQKSSPASTPPPSSHRTSGILATDGPSLTSSPPVFDSSASPRSRGIEPSDAMESSTVSSSSPTKENDSPFDPDNIKRTSLALTSPPSGITPTRSPLSWQRRPTSQASDRPRSRPLSMVAAENAAARSSPNLPEPSSATEQTFSREQIASALSGKDPSWFRQTSDRGQGSAAYRRNQVEDPDTLDMSSLRTQLPGMARAESAESARESTRQTSPTLNNTLGSPLQLTGASRLEPPTNDGPADSDSPERQAGRTSPTRPISPTKGMGGFVQSAMMKRSDSVKRWSVTSPGGLQRADSVSSNRNSLENLNRSSTSKPPRPSSALREGSKTPTSSRPTSSHANEPEPATEPRPSERAPTPEPKEPKDNEASVPVSPSKTMDPRRWSPTKSSSWLESALNKPESPKPKPTPPPSNQPAWMVELNKAKAQKAVTGPAGADGGEAARASSAVRKHEVRTGGLMRSSPMGTNVKPSPISAGRGFPPVAATGSTTPLGGLRSSLSKPSYSPAGENAAGDADDKDKSASAPGEKVKPETPPKRNDFRTNLKPRQTPSDTGGKDAPEFQNVFGNLKRTKTQNYVAPDELKNNIMMGKAALNITGGPKKTERKDEFKEAILKKKEDFKKAQQEGRGISRTATTSSEKPIPEGLSKKLEMSRTGTLSKRDSATSDTPVETPTRAFDSNRSSAGSTLSKRESVDITSPPRQATLPAPKPAPKPVGDSQPVFPPLHKETSAPARLQTKVGGSALADRFNPALAGLLARGPPMASGSARDSESPSAQPGSKPANVEEPSAPGPQLSHMTKNRARGPKRKAPTSAAKTTAEPDVPSSVSSAKQDDAGEVEKTVPKPQTPKPAAVMTSPKPAKPTPAPKPSPKPEVISLVDSSKRISAESRGSASGNVISLVDSSKRMSNDKPTSAGRPISFDGPAKGRPRSPTKVHEQVAALAAKNQQAPKPSEPVDDEVVSQPPSPRKLDLKRMSKFLDESAQGQSPTETEKVRPPSPVKARPLPDPVKSAAPKEPATDKVDSEPVVSVRNAKSLFGVASLDAASSALSGNSRASPSFDSSAPATQQRPVSPPRSQGRPLPQPIKSRPGSPTLPSPMRSPTKYALEISSTLTEFFGPARPKRKYEADAADILMKRPQLGPKIQTQKSQIFRLAGDGKKAPVPEHYMRVLFEREMYLCTHTFTNEAGKKLSEVYFWAGDEVPESTVEDAQLFANKEARSYGGKLIRLTQGKETPEFIQALGGIIIVRRGSSNKYDSLAPNMLCGRRYLGQIAFDEVDFSPSSLCSGFPYLITQQGKCHLWKGKGSDVDELGCARLVGMDLALMGELAEVEDGREPAEFWDIFDGEVLRHSSADHWRLKPNYDRYCGRLFCSDAADRKQIIELSPFSQSDLLPTNIYVLDAFFELYIIVGARSQHQYAAFRNALDFAQDYAILAAGMEDRPFVPISTVVLEGIPRDLRSVFRKWRDAAGPTIMNSSGSGSASAGSLGSPRSTGGSGQLKRGRSLRIVPLTQALQALRE